MIREIHRPEKGGWEQGSDENFSIQKRGKRWENSHTVIRSSKNL
jgi:hypothetical protein